MRATNHAWWLILALLWAGVIQARTISIPAGDASLTLRILVRRTHTSFLTGICTLKGVRTHAVSHAPDIQTALDVMLAGTGLTTHWTAPRFISVDDDRPGARPFEPHRVMMIPAPRRKALHAPEQGIRGPHPRTEGAGVPPRGRRALAGPAQTPRCHRVA